MDIQNRTRTRGNVIVENLKVGDKLWEYSGKHCITSVIISEPVLNEDEWTWESKRIDNNEVIDYTVNTGYLQYSPKLYDYDKNLQFS